MLENLQAEALDRILRTFEKQVVRPARIQQAARLLRSVVQRGMNSDVIAQIQQKRLQQAIQYLHQRSPFYQQLFRQHNIYPDDINTLADLTYLPLTTSDDLYKWQQFLCVPEDEISAVFTTAGSTGGSKRVYYTWNDMQSLTNLSAASLRVDHRGRLVALIALPVGHGLWMGGAIAQRTVERAGGLAIPTGTPAPEDTIGWMQRFEPNVIISSPSYMLSLTHTARAENFLPKLDRMVLGGEKLTEDQRELFHDYWQAEVYDSYGTTEIGGAQTIALPECAGLHLNDLHLITEIVDPETGQPADEGEMVFTTLVREAMPLLRYRSGDLARWVEPDCWLPFRAIVLKGRTDDMFTIGDAGLYGTLIQRQINDVPGTSGKIEITLDRPNMQDRLLLRVEGEAKAETVRKALFDVYPKLQERLESQYFALDIETGTDLRQQIKTLRIVDERE